MAQIMEPLRAQTRVAAVALEPLEQLRSIEQFAGVRMAKDEIIVRRVRAVSVEVIEGAGDADRERDAA